ncbi:MAG: hypothetical protein HWE10_13550 [Gammaproteobacteria bacterium]|nr:hypothetical protein [Gammaproteobacteria bacterium]
MMKTTLTLIMLVGISVSSFAGTGQLTGEQTSGLNKICYYNGASGSFSKTVSNVSLCPLSADDGKGFGGASSNTGFLSGQTTSGLNKTCYYNSPRGTFTKTVGSAQLCPQSAKQ